MYDGFGKLIAEYSTEQASTPTVNYTATDPLGSPGVITNKLGEVFSRRDFMPFGEEITPDASYRTAALKYGIADGVRQKFTGYQRDEETDLDFAEARYYYNDQGRFTAVDPLLASGKSANPQTFNRYVYVANNPLVHTDPTGMSPADYYAEDGKYLGSDGNAADTNIYIVKGKGKDNANTKLSPGVAIATLPNLAIRKAIGKMADRSNKPTHFYKGKDSKKNDPYGRFHEEGLVAKENADGTTTIINNAPGALATKDFAEVDPKIAANPNEQGALDTMLTETDIVVSHAHLEGGQFPPPKGESLQVGGELYVTPDQPPSPQDRLNSRDGRTYISTSSLDNKVYFYNSGGVNATFPLDEFRKVSLK